MADELVKKRITEYGTEVAVDELDNSDVIFVDSTQHGTRKLRLKGIRDIISGIQNESIKSSGVSVTADNYATTITNVNDQPVNTIYAYAAGLQLSVTNLPSNNALNIMHYTYKYSVATNVGQVQIAIERSGENPAMYFRTTSGTPVTWGSWVKVANNADIEAIRADLSDIGSKLRATDNAVYSLTEANITDGTKWELGKINSSGNVSDGTRIRTVGYIDLAGIKSLIITIDSGYRVGIHSYDASKAYLSDSGWITAGKKIIYPTSNAKYIRLVMSDTSNNNANIGYAAHLSIVSDTAFLQKVPQIDFSMNAFSRFSNKNEVVAYVEFENGNIASATGADETSGSNIDRLRTVGYISTLDVSYVAIDMSEKTWMSDIYYFNANYEFVTKTSNVRTSLIEINKAYPYFRLRVIDYSGQSWSNQVSKYDAQKDFTFYKTGNLLFLSDVTEISKKHFDSSRFQIGSLNAGVFYGATTYPYRIATPETMVFQFDLYLSVPYGYRFAYHSFSADGTFLRDSKWQTGLVKIPAGTYFRITMSKSPEGTTTPDVSAYCSKLMVSDLMYDAMSFSFGGNHISFSKQKYAVVDTTIKPTAPADITVGTVTSFQGFAYCKGVLFQSYADNVIELIEYETGSVIADLTTATGHGNCIVFTEDYYDVSDEFPIAIISDTLSSPVAYIVRITRSEVTILKTLTFPTTNAGYYANVMYDTLNGIIYTVGYAQNSYVNPQNNKMVFAKWDYKNLIQNEDTTYTPEFIEKFNTSFMMTMQAPAYFNGKLFVVSSHWKNTNTKIYIVDPVEKRISGIMDDFPIAINDYELEGISFFELDSDRYVGLLKTNNATEAYLLLYSE